LTVFATFCFAQDQQEPANPAEPAAAPQYAPAPVSQSGAYRKLAPGVEVTIPAEIKPEEKVSRHDLVEILAIYPDFGEGGVAGSSPAKKVRFPHEPQALEFTFKPMRFLRLDLPGTSGSLEPKLIWYMVYHVRNKSDKPMLFLPEFTLETKGKNPKVYPSKLIPLAVPLIRRREDPNRALYNPIEASGEIPPSTPEADNSVWGVVTWDDIDPNTNQFSVFVRGLSTAYTWEDPEGAYKAGDPPGSGRVLKRKTLQLNFWRPGDAFYEHEAEIRYGTPGDVDYRWIYR
jgi:hypothetical protein